MQHWLLQDADPIQIPHHINSLKILHNTQENTNQQQLEMSQENVKI
jgi:hypothetical protein